MDIPSSFFMYLNFFELELNLAIIPSMEMFHYKLYMINFFNDLFVTFSPARGTTPVLFHWPAPI